MHPVIEQLLKQRGITDPADIEEFLSDKPKRTYDPFLMKNMKEGVDLILDTVRKGGKICIYGDYDADGVTSITVLHRALACLTDRLTWYVPSRFTEGYGLNTQALTKIREEGTDLVITVDCGITSVEEVARGKELGLRFLITDHHSPGEALPDCIVIDPKQEGETYPFSLLAGCGVAYKLVQALQRTADLPRSVIQETLDMVGAGTVGDIVSLTDENRTIVKYGLRQLNRRNRPAMNALTDAISLGEITAENIAYGIIPHINAAGRMGDASDAVKLFLAEDEKTINEQVDVLISRNQERKSIQEEVWKRCEAMVTGEEKFIALRVEDIHEGIAGIAAGKLKESRHRPVILATPVGDGLVKGTGRSIPGIDIYAMMAEHRDLFLKFGGHKSACGFTMEDRLFPQLQEALIKEAEERYEADPEIFEKTHDWDMEIKLEDGNLEFLDELKQLEPFGEGNPAPKFRLSQVKILWPRFMGQEEQHVRFKAAKGNRTMSCVLFGRAQEVRELLEGDREVDLIGALSKNEWRDKVEVQFIVEDMSIGTE